MLFEFYLDAYQYCRINSIPISNIKKKFFKVWEVERVAAA